jgi:hypothetical protein
VVTVLVTVTALQLPEGGLAVVVGGELGVDVVLDGGGGATVELDPLEPPQGATGSLPFP